MGTNIETRRRKLLFLAASSSVLISGSLANATSYSWATPSTGGTWQNAANWTPNTGFPSSASDTGNIADSTASRTITYSSAAASAVGTLTMTQANNFVNELDVQQSGGVTLSISNGITLSASGTGTSYLFLDPVIGANKTETLAAPSIAVNAGGVLELSSFDNTANGTALSQLAALSGGTLTVSIGGGTLYSDQGVGTASSNSDANTINGSLTMTSGTISFGLHQAAALTNAVKSGSTIGSVNDRLYVFGTLSITGGAFLVNTSTDTLFLEGASNSIQLTGNPAIGGTVLLSNLASGTQTFRSDSAVTNNLTDRQTNTTINLASYLQLGSVSGGTLSIGSITFRSAASGQTQTIQLESSIASIVPNYSGNAVSTTDVIDLNGFTFDTSAGTGTFALIGAGTGIDNIINTAGAGSVGTVKAVAFDLSKLASGENVGSYVNLQATGLGVSTLSASSGNATTIDPASTFTFAPTATGVGTILSNRAIGNLVVSSQTLNLGNAITTGATSAVTVASAGTLNLNGFALSTGSFTSTGTVNGTTAGSALSTTGNFQASGTVTAIGGITTSGNFSPGTIGTVGTLKLGTSTTALTFSGTGSTATFDLATPTSMDLLNANGGTVNYAGTLAVNFGYTPAVGAIFDLFSNVGSFTGNFATITSNLSGSSYSFDPGSGNLTVLAVPEPAMLSMLGVSAMLMLRRRRSRI